MQKLKERWQITESWQWIFPFLGTIALLATGYALARRLLHAFQLNNTDWEGPFTVVLTIIIAYFALLLCLWCFKKLEHKWVVDQKWEMIAIFIVFAITGSLSARLAKPLVNFLGLHPEEISGWIYWPIRILIILPIYQILLVFIGWLFGQFTFFWGFSKKMLKRMGLGFLLK